MLKSHQLYTVSHPTRKLLYKFEQSGKGHYACPWVYVAMSTHIVWRNTLRMNGFPYKHMRKCYRAYFELRCRVLPPRVSFGKPTYQLLAQLELSRAQNPRHVAWHLLHELATTTTLIFWVPTCFSSSSWWIWGVSYQFGGEVRHQLLISSLMWWLAYAVSCIGSFLCFSGVIFH